MLIATVVFLAGRKQYKKVKRPTRNVTADFAGAVWLSIKHRLVSMCVISGSLVCERVEALLRIHEMVFDRWL
jgi:hypothetical protein